MNKHALKLVVVLAVCLAPLAARAQSLSFSQGFETDTSGWVNFGNGSVLRVPSGYANAGGYADRVNSSDGDFLARLLVDPLASFGQGAADCVPGSSDCSGPYTDWGLNFTASHFPIGGDFTSVDIYLDTSFAAAHPGYRFDWNSSLNDSTGQFLQDFVFNVGTGTGKPSDPCGSSSTAHFVIAASTRAGRKNANLGNPEGNPQCITASGWYTFRHAFKADLSGNLEVDMTIRNKLTGAVVASWTIHPACTAPQSVGLCTEGHPLPISAVGGNLYGWFPNQEIDELAIDDALLRTFQPQTAGDCKKAWQSFSAPAFKSESECISFVANRDN
jgi:hypothetical protein